MLSIEGEKKDGTEHVLQAGPKLGVSEIKVAKLETAFSEVDCRDELEVIFARYVFPGSRSSGFRPSQWQEV